MSLADFQEAFTQAMLSSKLTEQLVSDIPQLPQSPLLIKQVGVYRNSSLKGFTSILKAAYPTIFEILGEETFTVTGESFFLKTPAKNPDPLRICEFFAAHLEELNITKEMPYLPDVATLDLGCFQSKQTMEATPVSKSTFTEISPELLSTRKVQLHPACFWMSSPFAIYDLWQHYSEKKPDGSAPNPKIPQEVVILRSNVSTDVHKVNTGLVRTLDALDDGEALNTALQKAGIADPEFNPVSALQFLIEKDLVVSLY